MRTIGRAACLISMAAAAAGGALAAPTADAGKAATAFYGVYRTLPRGGVPDPAGLAKLAPTITSRLKALLDGAAAAEERHARATKNEEPPLIEGDLFSSLFEGASEAKVGACRIEPVIAKCDVALVYDPKGKPVTWTDTVILAPQGAGWRVDDIEYGGTWAFGNRGRLSETLKAVIAEVRAE